MRQLAWTAGLKTNSIKVRQPGKTHVATDVTLAGVTTLCGRWLPRATLRTSAEPTAPPECSACLRFETRQAERNRPLRDDDYTPAAMDLDQAEEA